VRKLVDTLHDWMVEDGELTTVGWIVTGYFVFQAALMALQALIVLTAWLVGALP
jgi:hypothetical protein